jgi:nucleotide-binding universal stress UspA family protein
MIASLLVALDSSAYAHSAREQAVAIAKVYGARLTGVYVLDIRYVEMPPYVDYSYTFEAVAPVVAPADMMGSFRAKSARILTDFQEAVAAVGPTVQTRAEEGVPSQVIADLGRSHDLIVMGKRGEHARWGRDLLGSTAENVARRSAVPVLLVEPEYRALSNGVVLFDGSDPANRALKLAADLAVHTGLALKVVTADDDPERGRATQAAASAYLGPLGVRADYEVVPGRAAKAAAGLLKKEAADLLVMGMRGHFVLHDLILGGTAEQLMRSVELPILLVP